MRKTGMAIGILAMLLAGCQRGEPARQEAVGAQEEAEKVLPGSPDEVVMKGDNLRMTMADYNRCVALHRFEGRWFSKRALANPRFHRDEAQRCFQIRMMRDYVEKHGLKADDAMREGALNEALARANVGNRLRLEQKMGVTSAELDAVIDDALLAQVMQKSMAMAMSDEEARKLFKIEMRRYMMDMIAFENAPTDEEAADYASSHAKDISAYLSAHPEKLYGPAHANFVRMGYPKTGGAEDAAAYRAADALRLYAIQQGTEKALARCESEAAKGCAVYNGMSNLYREARNEKNAWAFRNIPGSVSELIPTPVGQEIWIVQSIEPPQAYDLADGPTKLRLNREAMAALAISPKFLETIKPELEAPVPDLEAIAKAHGGKYLHLEDATFLSLLEEKLVESPEVLRVLGEMNAEQARLLSNPILDGGKIYIFIVRQLTIPGDSDYEQLGAAWRIKKSNDRRAPFASKWLLDNRPSLTSLNLRPVEAEYGILQENGTIK